MKVNLKGGFCPKCGADGEVLNIALNNWRACHECQICWCHGWGFNESSPGTEAEWAENAASLVGYCVVAPGESRLPTVTECRAQTSEVFDRVRADANVLGIDPGTRVFMEQTLWGPDEADRLRFLLETLY